MKKQALVLAVIATTGLAWISPAAAQGPGSGPGDHRQGPPMGRGFGPGEPGGPGGPPLDMMARHLGLSDEQKGLVKAIHERQMEAAKPLMKAAGETAEAFHAALEGDNSDPAAVGRAAIAMRNARRAVEGAHKAAFEEVKAILTPEQRAKVEEMEKRRSEHGDGPGFGPGGPGGPGGWGRGGRHGGKNRGGPGGSN